ncbi:MAG: dihydrodipicolinate synthase family protein, partial [Candidatus Acidiferrales bacterium]
ENMKGLWTTPTIPFTEDFKLDEAGIRRNVDRMIQAKCDGIGFGFSEPWVCSIEERKRGIEISVDAIRGRVHSYIHATDHSVPETIALIRQAEAVGAEAVMVWAPYEWAKSQDMVVDFFEYIASQVDIAIFAYNTYHSGICLTPESIQRICKIPNICAVKDAVNDVAHTIRVIDLVGDQVVVSTSIEDHLLTMTLHFGQQILLGTTSVYLMQSPHRQPVREYWELARAGNGAEASRKYYELQPLRDVWKGIYQSLWNKSAALHPLPLIKYWMDLVGMSGGPVRPPLHQATDEEKEQFKAALLASGWLEKLYPEGRGLEKKAAAALGTALAGDAAR